MVLNDFEKDIKIKCIEKGVTQSQLADMVGTTGQYINRTVKNGDKFINNTFVKIMHALGYDLEVIYHPIDETR